MRKKFVVIISIPLLLFCSCGKKAQEVISDVPKEVVSDVPQAPAFLAAKAESVMAEQPEASQEKALRYLQDFDSKVGKEAVLPGDGLTSVKYHTGLSHSSEGMVVNGSRGGDPTVPPAKSYYHEFHYDSEGKLSHIVENNKEVRTLTNLFYYDGPNPMARICFVQGKYSYSDLAFYDEGAMYFKCRIAPDGKVLSGGLITK